MKNLTVVGAVMMLSLTHCAWAEGESAAAHEDYIRLLKATKYVENYKRVAAASARVFDARSQENDAEFARFLSVIAGADLSDVDDCLAAVYATQGLTKEEVQRLVAIFESSIGSKLNEHSNRMLIDAVERGRHEPMSLGAFTEAEKERIRELQKDPAYQRYAVMTTNRDVWAGMMKCFLGSEDVREAGIKQ